MELLQCDLPGVRKVRSGKVREIFDLGDKLLLVATDRISAFDCILPNAIPGKGEVLSQLSAFWFRRFDFVKNHVIATEFSEFPEVLRPFESELSGRSMIVRKAEPLPVECVVRGYLAGSGWKEYAAAGSISGHQLPPGLSQAEKLPETIFTPSTKADQGHDVNIDWKECRRLAGESVARQIRDLSIRIYEAGSEHARARGIIVADTKFEFGLLDGEVILIDEVLTPDSSRFWPADQYHPGTSPPSYDKQFVRDYLESLPWDKTPPAPSLPDEVVKKTAQKYREAHARLTR
jgi:phosphoribosylaminoimidazole-succinocarboxamide synthase